MSFVKSKGASFINRPVGVVSTRTGAEELYQTITRTANAVSNDLFALAKQEEIKKGKDFGMSVQTRDSNGALRIEKAPDTFSDIAKQTAQSELNRIYANELANDINIQLTKARANSNGDVEAFQKLASTYLGETEKVISSQGGSQYVPMLRRAGSRYMAQHQNALVLQAAKDAERKATNLELNDIGNKLIELDALISDGVEFFDDELTGEDLSVDSWRESLVQRVNVLLNNGKISNPKHKEIVGEIQKTFLTARTRYKLNPMGNSLDINAINILKNFALDGSLTDTEKETLAKYDVDDAWLEDFDKISRTNRDYIVQRINQFGTAVNARLTLIGKKNKDIDFARRFDGNDIIKFSADDEERMDSYLAKKYNNGQPLTNNDIYRISSTQQGLSDILKHNGLSKKIKHLFQNLPQFLAKVQTEGDKALPELIKQVDLFKNLYARHGTAGNITNQAFRDTIGNGTFEQWLSLTTRIGLYGEENVAGILKDIQSTDIDAASREVMQKKNLSIIDSDFIKFGVNASVDALMRKYIDEGLFGTGADFNPESILYMKMVAKKELAIDNTDESTLKEVLKNTYNALYIESSVIFSESQQTGESAFYTFGMGTKYLRSRFAPERFFGTGEVFDGFKLYVNNHVKKIMGDGKDYKLGENIFLFPTKRSGTLSTAEYMVVSSDGQSQLLKQDGDIIAITTNGYMKKLNDENRVKYLARIEELRKQRLKRIRGEKKLTKKLNENQSVFQQILKSFTATQDITGQLLK